MAEEVARACAAESARTYQYLAGQRLIAQRCAAGRDPGANRLHGARSPRPAPVPMNCSTKSWTCSSAAAACGLKRTAGRFVRATCCSCRCWRRSRRGSSSPARRSVASTVSGRRDFALKSVAAVVMFACLLFAANELVRSRARCASRRHECSGPDRGRRPPLCRNPATSLPAMPTTLDNLRAVVARFDAMAGRSAGPQEMYARISRGTRGNRPRSRPERIEWFAQHESGSKQAQRGEPTPVPAVAAPAAPPRHACRGRSISGTLPLNRGG
ncbi:MAG: hypothetical protein MZW92_18255 [Comamonadaceae bacterium]|nr:hypothetical protein [Comamonadaceae bacterium]